MWVSKHQVICLALKQAIPDECRKYKVADSAVKMDRLRNTQKKKISFEK